MTLMLVVVDGYFRSTLGQTFRATGEFIFPCCRCTG